MSSISKGSNEQKGLINMFVIEASGKYENGKLAGEMNKEDYSHKLFLEKGKKR